MLIKKGFTLSEVMITLGILGVLAAITIPAVMNVAPDTTKVMFKKAYSTVEKTVSAMISDDTIYPESVVAATTDVPSLSRPEGFYNWADKASVGVPGTNDKFCYLFAQQVNFVGTTHCDTALGTEVNSNANLDDANNANDNLSFTTSDGINWYFSHDVFTFNSSGYNTVLVDVNGSKVPNCLYNAATCAKPDRFRFGIRYDGKIKVYDQIAQDILTDPTKNVK